MSEEENLLLSAVKEFCTKVIDNLSISIERDGIKKDLVKKIAEQGFLALTLPAEKGGAGVSRKSYLKMLAEFSNHSPSVAVLLMSVNSVILPVLAACEGTDKIMADVMSGEMIPSIPLNTDLLSDSDSNGIGLAGNTVKGSVPYLLGFGWDEIIASFEGETSITAIVKSGITPVKNHSRLGFRGLSLKSVNVESADNEVFKLDDDKQSLSKLLDDLNLEVAAVALGIADGSLAKAIEYSKVRSSFEHLLKDYQPIAFPITKLLGEKAMLEDFLLEREDFSDAEKLYAKLVAVELARDSSRQSIQTHGGYGYLEDFGVEKFYRDSMALSVIFGTRIMDQEKLSDIVFESKSGFI